MRQIIGFSLIAILAILVGCKSHKVPETSRNTIPQGNWVLIKMEETPVKAADYDHGFPSIVFKDSSSFSGSTGCNQYMATYKHSPENITIKMGPLTKMFCPGDAEQNVLNAFNQTNRVEVKDDILSFYENEKSLMTFKRSH